MSSITLENYVMPETIVVIAGPGAGKATILDPTEKTYGHAQIATGDAIRDFAAPNDELKTIMRNSSGALKYAHDAAVQSKIISDKGLLAKTEHMRILINAKKELLGHPKKVAFDGFPRNLHQAEILTEVLGTDDYEVRFMDVSKDNLVLRQGFRRDSRLKYLFGLQDQGLGDAVFKEYSQIENESAKIAFAEGFLGTKLTDPKLGVRKTDIRLEDRIIRAGVFFKETMPAAEFFYGKPNYKEFDGNGSKPEVYNNFMDTFSTD